MDIFGRKERKLLNQLEAAYGDIDDLIVLKERVEREKANLILALRKMDQLAYNISQKMSWDEMRPLFADMMVEVNERMARESKRIASLMVTEIKEAYSESKTGTS